MYKFDNVYIADNLIAAAKRGISIRILISGNLIGGLGESAKQIILRLMKAGISIYFYAPDISGVKNRRYNFIHAKYIIIDQRTVIMASENLSLEGLPVHPSFGNRGWLVSITNKKLGTFMQKVFSDDCDPNHQDIISLDNINLAASNNTRTPNTRARKKISTGDYELAKAPLRLNSSRYTTKVEVILSPDNSLNEKTGIIGAINKARDSILIEQLRLDKYWGKKLSQSPNLILSALINAAKRGVKIRILLDGNYYSTEPNNDRDNDNTAKYLRRYASRNDLDIEAKLSPNNRLGIAKIHNKGMIIDEKQVLIGSINWTENSLKNNRETALLISNPDITAYYLDLFLYDWFGNTDMDNLDVLCFPYCEIVN
jgi:phosphatidylserine/phosphatidylglycerophosphate/cardiolipin synthase-like enzyme